MPRTRKKVYPDNETAKNPPSFIANQMKETVANVNKKIEVDQIEGIKNRIRGSERKGEKETE